MIGTDEDDDFDYVIKEARHQMVDHNITAIIYDFDGTLAEGNLHEHQLLPDIKVSKEEFWESAKQDANEHDGDEMLSYMRLTIERFKENNERILNKEDFRKYGQSAKLFKGVEVWFERINDHARTRNLTLEHCIISSGLKEMIEGCAIAINFKHIFASHYTWVDENVIWPAVAANYTMKMQYLFRINKGIYNHWDNKDINKWIPMNERRIPFNRIIFIGDGETDIPTMRTVQELNGTSIAVFDPSKWIHDQNTRDLAYRLIAEDRVHFVAPADYSEISQLDVIVKGVLGKIAREAGYRGD
jgi:phosphoserine phosphatase